MPTDPEFTELRQQWDLSRKQSRQMAADAQELRRKSRELVKQWRLIVARTKELHMAKDQSGQLPPAATVAQQNVYVATARRLPWRRVQMEDLDAPVKVWFAPEFQEI